MNMNDTITAKIAELTAEIAANPADASLLYERGKLYWRKSMRAEAITDFNMAVELDPDSPARIRLEMTNEIMDFYNPDLLNP